MAGAGLRQTSRVPERFALPIARSIRRCVTVPAVQPMRFEFVRNLAERRHAHFADVGKLWRWKPAEYRYILTTGDEQAKQSGQPETDNSANDRHRATSVTKDEGIGPESNG